MARLQRLHDLLLVVDGQPVGRAERLVDVPEAGRQRGRLLAAQQRVAFLVDRGRVVLRFAAELVGVLEHLAVPRGNLGGARILLVGREPERLERLEPGRRLAVGPVPRADDVIDEVALVLGQVELARGHARRVAGHDVVVMEPDRRRRAAQQVAVLAVPERQQHVAVRAQEHADLGVLARAARPAFRDGSRRRARQQRQFEDLGGLVAEFARTARADSGVKSSSYSTRGIGSTTLSGMPSFSASSATRRSAPSASEDITTMMRLGYS